MSKSAVVKVDGRGEVDGSEADADAAEVAREFHSFYTPPTPPHPNSLHPHPRSPHPPSALLARAALAFSSPLDVVVEQERPRAVVGEVGAVGRDLPAKLQQHCPLIHRDTALRTLLVLLEEL